MIGTGRIKPDLFLPLWSPAMQYQPPVNDIKFVLFDVLGADQLHTLDKYSEASPDIISAVIEEAGKLAAEVLQPP